MSPCCGAGFASTAWRDLSDARDLLFLHDVPDVVLVVAGHVARILVLGEGVERLAVVGPLHGPVGAFDDREIADRLVRGASEHRRPILGAFTRAVRLSGLV